MDLSGTAGFALRAMGLNPEEIEKYAVQFGNLVKGFDSRLNQVLVNQTTIIAMLENIQHKIGVNNEQKENGNHDAENPSGANTGSDGAGT